ncbi:alpha-amylase family glycosyl hydrolase [Paenibacillus sp. URB8-2]|uniref:alpha-amylase family glycosyl hydrolase n=1 Tax=Paenibacillus sp. URB8-2 TaxID=2741301 RepID=UPI0015BAF236|nr:alpha-amylase family glycosyl hydrolase [Paenibacillus sp. URB8-2]BCG60986.1 alpha-amylase [Paenibacillus sp. URB8-2]
MKKFTSMALSLPLLFSFASGALAKSEVHPEPQSDSNLGVYYEIYVNSFSDSNNDGNGDLNGVLQKLDYLNDGNPHTKKDLGVDSLWLMPISPSPSYHKYDTTDFYSVDPEYGSTEDFRRLTEEAHKRGMKVTIDLALNHTSNKHPWFLDAVKDKNSPYRDYYIWADKNTDLNEKGPWGQQLWYESYPGSGDYYYALFIDFMPDLNFDNPKLREEMINVGKHWLNQGADGFRLDAAMHIYSKADEAGKNVAWWDEFKRALAKVKPDVYLVGEVWDRPNNIAPYYKALDSSFDFDLSSKILDAVQNGSDNGLASFASNTLDLYRSYTPDPIDAPFLTNHDQERTMSILNGDVNKAKSAASILLTLPGNPFIYYGEEIGMLGKKPDENIREPFRWYPESGEGQTDWEPSRDNTGPDAVSVEAQIKDKDSLLSHYKELIRFRHESPALMKGDIREMPTGDSRIIGYTRTFEDDSVLVLHNLSGETVTIQLSNEAWQGRKIEFSTSNEVKIKKAGDQLNITIPAYTTCGLK